MDGIFWSEADEPAQGEISLNEGGIFYRAFDLVEFLHKVEANGRKITGIKFEADSHNIEVITVKTEQKK